jgi:hypothetical protein
MESGFELNGIGYQMTENPSNIRCFLPKDATAKYVAILSEVQKYHAQKENENGMAAVSREQEHGNPGSTR